MEKLINGFGDLLLNMGLPGLVIAVLIYVVYRLGKLYIEAQEKRIIETQATTSALVSSAVALNRVSDLIEQRKV